MSNDNSYPLRNIAFEFDSSLFGNNHELTNQSVIDNA